MNLTSLRQHHLQYTRKCGIPSSSLFHILVQQASSFVSCCYFPSVIKLAVTQPQSGAPASAPAPAPAPAPGPAPGPGPGPAPAPAEHR